MILLNDPDLFFQVEHLFVHISSYLQYKENVIIYDGTTILHCSNFTVAYINPHIFRTNMNSSDVIPDSNTTTLLNGQANFCYN